MTVDVEQANEMVERARAAQEAVDLLTKTEERDHVVFYRRLDPTNGSVVRRAYGPFTRAEAQQARRRFIAAEGSYVETGRQAGQVEVTFHKIGSLPPALETP